LTEKLEDQTDGNSRVVDSKSRRIMTLDELVQACQIDLEEWKIERHVINKWEVGIKDEVSGSQIIVEPLFQVKVWLIKRKPEPVFPVISPIEIRVSSIKKRALSVNNKGRLQRTLVIADPQFGFWRNIYTNALEPFHDRIVLDIARQISQEHDFESVIVVGDAEDFAEWSGKFTVEPEFYFTTQPALIETAWWLDQIGVTDYIEGNHEHRMNKAIKENMLAAYALKSVDEMELPPVLSVPYLLGLEKRGIKYYGNYPDGEIWLNKRVRVSHGNVVRQPGKTAIAVAKDSDFTEIYGHTHRIEWACKTIHARDEIRVVTAFSPGCACRIDGAVPGNGKRHQWQQGVGIVEYDDERCNIIPVPVNNGEAVYMGTIYSGADRIKQILADTNELGRKG